MKKPYNNYCILVAVMERQQKINKSVFNTTVNLANDFGFSVSKLQLSNGNLEFSINSNCELARFFELALVNELRSSLLPE